MNAKYQLPRAMVLQAETVGDLSVVRVEISREDYLSYPIAPGDLRLSDPFQTIWEFHQLTARKGPILSFETYETELALPRVDQAYNFCSWWVDTAMDAVCDLDAVWERLPYPDNGSHDHCLLTHKNLSAQGPLTDGYKSIHGWISVAAYEKYILKDALRMRNHNHSIEKAA